MSEVWNASCRTHTAKLVLLALADNANDSGWCWPSITHLATKCSLSRRGVIDQVKALEVDGHLSRVKNEGNVTRYCLHPVKPAHPCKTFTGEQETPPPVQVLHRSGAGDAPPPVQEMHATGAGDAPTRAGGSPEPSITVNEPTREATPPMPAGVAGPEWDTPTEAQVLQSAANQMIPENVAELFYSDMEAAGWVDAKQRPVRSWQHALKSFSSRYASNEAERKDRESKRGRGGSGPLVPADTSQDLPAGHSSKGAW